MAASWRRRQRRRKRRYLQPARLRFLRDRSNPVEKYNATEFFDRYRFRKDTILLIMSLISFKTTTLRSNPIPPIMQLLTTIRYLATGSFQSVIGDTLEISQASVSRIVRSVAGEIAGLSSDLIKFPCGVLSNQVKEGFYKIAGFPNVTGCIDCTHIRIKAPKNNEADYVNRKGFHSLNVQMTCDPAYRITSVVAKWPGSCHDSRIFRESNLFHLFETGNCDGLLLGDSGYPCKSYLMTPFINPSDDHQIQFNSALSKTRALIEQTFGILKRRFAILHSEVRSSEIMACTISVCSAVLHNIGIDCKDIVPTSDLRMCSSNDDTEPSVSITVEGIQDGKAIRNHIAQTYF